MKASAGRRGHPLVALIVLLGGWVSMRAALWDGPRPFPAAEPPESPLDPQAQRSSPELPRPLFGAGSAENLHPFAAAPKEEDGSASGRVNALPVKPLLPSYRAFQDPLPRPVLAPVPPVAPAASKVPVALSGSHQLMWMAAIARLPMPSVLAASLPAAAQPVPPATTSRSSSWSADGWLLLRPGGGAGAQGPSPTYGASQAGAVVRYQLAPNVEPRPAAYVRATAALNGSGEKEAALGISARPVSGVPVVASVELRATSQPGATRLRPAAFVVTEIAPFDLPQEFRGEAYGQAGYVGGSDATPFADGQLRVDRQLTEIADAEVRTGLGAWGGAQKGASRLDIGPTATIAVPVSGRAAARIGMDWRFRIAGGAEPSSGPALTLSAGF